MSTIEENEAQGAATNTTNNNVANEPSSLMDGGRVTPQLSTAIQLDRDVSPNTSPTQPYDELNSNATPQQPHLLQQQQNKINNNQTGNYNGLNSNRSSPLKSLNNTNYSDNEDDYELQRNGIVGAAANDYWSQRNGGLANQSGRQSRAGASGAATPNQLQLQYPDNMSENSEQPPVQPLQRSKSRPELSSNAHINSVMSAASRYSNLSYWKARRVVFYRNGDPFFPGVELRFRPGRDITSLENLLDKISPKIDLPRGARYVFSMDGDRKYHLDELEDGASYVVSSFKAFKVSKMKFCTKYFITKFVFLVCEKKIFLFKPPTTISKVAFTAVFCCCGYLNVVRAKSIKI
ncbi:Echinoderm microtubule-associated protein-like [Lucilia cuprina]|nr:Echinoderm microtubule-associated protein-like [Lucilia cuprina]